MLRNMKVGTKLLAVVLPPLLVLVIVAGLGASDRLAEASDAQTAEQYIDLTAASADLVTELQAERSLSVLAIADPEAVEGLDEQRDATDAAAEDFAAAVRAAGGSQELADTADTVTSRLEMDITTMRNSVDRGGIDPLIVSQWYGDTIDLLLEVSTTLSNEVPVTDVSADMASLVTLARSQEAFAQIQSILAVALANDEFDAEGRQWREFLDSMTEARQYETLYYAIATPSQAAELRGLLQSGAADESGDFHRAIVDAQAPYIDWLDTGQDFDGEPNSIAESLSELEPPVTTLTPMAWIGLSTTLIDAHAQVTDQILTAVDNQVSTIRSETERQALLYVALTVIAILASSLLALVVARRITRPLRSLTDAADRLSSEQLPALVERLKSPGSSSGEVILEPINMKREDEIGHLADAFDAIQRVTVEVAEEQQTLLKKGIGDIFVNLARRNQSLLDRQIEFIDQLESQEEDPDVLEDLFKLDHLATRMRRNAESLLVLAGVETSNRRSRAVALADVVRVAVGEVEDFARLNLVSIDDAVVTGAAAMDVAHLLSELMENATAFSPPETGVEVLGHLNSDGTYVLSISDQGIGMSDEQFTETNTLLANPPLVGLTLSRSLGFTVVGRLASRFDIDVRLTSSPTGGVTALITLPTAVLETSTITVEPDVAAADDAAVADSEPVSVPADVVDPERAFDSDSTPSLDPILEVDDESEVDEPGPTEWIPDAPAPSTLAGAVPEGAAFDAGLAALIGDESPNGNGAEPAPVAEQHAEFADTSNGNGVDSGPEPVRTSAGLVKRVPRAATTGTDTSDRPTAEAPVARTQRSPEEVRAMLSRYRSGLHRGRDGDTNNGSSNDGTD